MGPEPGRVEGGDVAAALLGRVELRGETLGIRSLADEVVARLARGARPHPLHALLVERQRRVEQDHAGHEVGEAQRDVLDHGAAEVAADENGRCVTEVIVHERVDVSRM